MGCPKSTLRLSGLKSWAPSKGSNYKLLLFSLPSVCERFIFNFSYFEGNILTLENLLTFPKKYGINPI